MFERAARPQIAKRRERSVTAGVSDARELFRQASEEENAGRLDSARVLYERVLELAPKVLRAWLFYANALMKLERFEDALLALPHAQESRSPEIAGMAWNFIAKCHCHLKRLPEAEAAFRQSLATHETGYAWIFLSSVLRDLNREDEAEECLWSALALDPNYEEAHCNLGDIYILQDRFDEAEHHLQRAIEIDPVYARYGVAGRSGLEVRARSVES